MQDCRPPTFVDEGSVNVSGGYPPCFIAWFYVPYDGKAVLFSDKEKTAEQQDSVNAKKELTDAIGKITREYEAMNEQMQKMNQTIALLIESDKDDIKAWITREHHYFCYDLGYIDDYSLDCLEKRFSHYKDEGGNSFIKDLMDEIRQLPRESTQRLYSDKTQEQEENRR